MASQPSQKLTTQMLVSMLSQVLGMDMNMVAHVAGVPQKNLQAWIAGKRKALRLSSIVAILRTVGIRIDAMRTVLDDSRVHFWDVKVPAFGGGRRSLRSLTDLSKLLQAGFITEVRPAGVRAGLRQRLFRRHFLISGLGATGVGFKVVVCLHTYPWRKIRITPEIVKGASWRDDNDHHMMSVSSEAWQWITSRDMTVSEFDRAFESVKSEFNWSDVMLMAREFGVSSEDIAEHILKTHEANEPETTARGSVRFLLGAAAA